MIEYKLRKAEEKDFKAVFAIKLDAMKDYITQTWGWDEELQRKFHKEEFENENIFIIEVDSKPIGTVGINEKKTKLLSAVFIY